MTDDRLSRQPSRLGFPLPGGRAVLGALAAGIALLALGAGSAFGYFVTTDSSAPALTAATSLSAPTTPTAVVADSTTITVGWALPGTQLSNAEYEVTRTSPAPASVVCTVASTVTSCQDSNLTPGTTYGYSVMAVLPASSWQSSAITASRLLPKETPSITTTANPASVTVGGSADDQASFTGGYDPTGTITWGLYPASDTTCATTPTFASSGQAVNGQSLYTSGSYTTTATGVYKWGFVYSGDSSNNAVSVCGGAGESLTVTAASPVLATSASSATVGNGLTDTATVSQGYKPTGTLTFTLYGPGSTPSCTTGDQVGQTTTTVNGNGQYTSSALTPSQAGTYWWIAVYGGDPNNNSVADTCGSSGETSTVAPVTPSITTNATPSSLAIGGSVADNATVSGGYNPTGTITWKLYANSACSGSPVFTSSGQAVNGNSTYTTPNSFTTMAIGTFTWAFTYSGDVNNNPVTTCGGANESVTVTQASPTLTGSAPPSDVAGTAVAASSISADLEGAYNPGGQVTFYLYGPVSTPPSGCPTGGTPLGAAVTVGADGVVHPTAGFTPASAGDYWVYAAYSGDTYNAAAASVCDGNATDMAGVETVVTSVPVVITAVTGDQGNDKVMFSGTAVAGGSIVVTVCAVDPGTGSCPSASVAATTVAVTVSSSGTWVTGATTNSTNGGNLSDGGQYYAQAAETTPTGTSAVVAFKAEAKTTASATVTAPVSTTCYYNSNSGNCTGTKSTWSTEGQKIAGTGATGTGPALKSVQVALENPSGLWWNGSAFSSSVPVFNATGGTPAAWSMPVTAAQLGAAGTFTIRASVTDVDNMTNIESDTTFVWKA